MATETYDGREWYKLALGIGGVAGWALLLRPLSAGGGRVFLYELLDAVYVRTLFPGTPWAVSLYYVLMAGLLSLSIALFFRRNRRWTTRRAAALR